MRRTLRKADGFCPTVTDRLDSRVLRVPSPRTRILANFGVGFEHIDLDAARRAGIAVTNTPDVLTDCTADLAMALILATARGIACAAIACCEPGTGRAGGPCMFPASE